MTRGERNKAAPDFFSPQVSQARRFFLDLNPPKGRRLSVVCGGCEHCTSDYSIQRESFPYYSIEYVIRGCGTVTLQNRTHALQAGSVFSYGPRVAQRIATKADAPLVKYFVDFAGTGALQLLRSCRLPAGTASRVFPGSGIQALFDELIQTGLHGGRPTPEICMKLLECLALKIGASGAPVPGAETLSFATYQHCRQHLQAHFSRLKTLQQLAQDCRVNAAYLCRLFRRYDHQSPYHQLQRLKLNQAAEWLQQPGALVKQVSERAGFADPFHFSRAFKRVFGIAPEAFRRLR